MEQQITPDTDAAACSVEPLLGRIHQGNCIERMQQIADGEIDLVFADPPFNIGYQYDVYEDRLESDQYLDWSRQWMGEVHRILKPSGAFWLAIGDEYAAELKIVASRFGFHCRSWVIWYYTFGVHCKLKFTRSHAHLFHFVKDAKQFTFNNQAVRVPSARQLVYGDSRANPAGRMPDDTWILRPQDLVDGFTPDEDVWYFPRVAGTFKERAGFHGCQMPEQLLGRIIRACSDENEIVLDPFSGSATTATVAKKLGRRWLAFELSEEYAQLGTARLEATAVGDPLDGAAEPTISAPATGAAKKSAAKKETRRHAENPAARDAGRAGFRQGRLEFGGLSDHDEMLIEVLSACHDGFSVDRMVADPVLNEDFQTACDRQGIPGTPAERNRRLFHLRKGGEIKAAGIETEQRTGFSWKSQSRYIFASEIAWRQMINDYPGRSLDEILCDPRLAAQFDVVAERFAPGYRPLEYRWAALTLRKKLGAAKKHARDHIETGFGMQRFDSAASFDQYQKNPHLLPASPGVYAICNGRDEFLYVGETSNLRDRLTRHFASQREVEQWQGQAADLAVSHHVVETVDDYHLARQCILSAWYRPVWNVVE